MDAGAKPSNLESSVPLSEDFADLRRQADHATLWFHCTVSLSLLAFLIAPVLHLFARFLA